MLTLDRKKGASHSRAKAQPARRSQEATPSGHHAREHAPSCACGGACPRCQAASRSPQGTCAECAKDEEESRSTEPIKPPTGTIGDGHDLQAARFSGDLVLEGCFDNEQFLRFGSTGPAVEKVQQALIDAGFPLPKFGVDGLFKSETQGAVRDFQRSQGLEADGIVGPLTMGALDRLFAGPAPAPAPAPPAPAPAPPAPAPAPPAPAPAPPAPAPAPPAPAPAPPAPAPAPPAPAPAPAPPAPAPSPAPSESITSETVVTTPGPRTRTDVGVGEQVTLTHTPGSVRWSTTAGTLSAKSGDSVVFSAPDTAKSVTVTGGKATIQFNVIAPNDVHMDRFGTTGVKHTAAAADSGIETLPFLLPDTVNFTNVSYRELNVGATVTKPGAYSCFRNFGHCRKTAGGACSELLMMPDNVVAGKGTQAILGDCVYSGDCQQTPPFTPGNITFKIPYEYRVGTGRFRQFKVVTQVSELAADGTTLTSDKAGAHGDTTVTSPTVTITACP